MFMLGLTDHSQAKKLPKNPLKTLIDHGNSLDLFNVDSVGSGCSIVQAKGLICIYKTLDSLY